MKDKNIDLTEEQLALFARLPEGTTEEYKAQYTAEVERLKKLPVRSLHTNVHHRKRIDGSFYSSCMSNALRELSVDGLLSKTYEFFGLVIDPAGNQVLFYYDGRDLLENGIATGVRKVMTVCVVKGKPCSQTYAVQGRGKQEP